MNGHKPFQPRVSEIDSSMSEFRHNLDTTIVANRDFSQKLITRWRTV